MAPEMQSTSFLKWQYHKKAQSHREVPWNTGLSIFAEAEFALMALWRRFVWPNMSDVCKSPLSLRGQTPAQSWDL